MNGFNNFLGKINFRKIFIGYVIIAVIIGVLCSAAVGYIYKDKIGLAISYKSASEKIKNKNTDISIRIF